jgi:hypothetical protein
MACTHGLPQAAPDQQPTINVSTHEASVRLPVGHRDFWWWNRPQAIFTVTDPRTLHVLFGGQPRVATLVVQTPNQQQTRTPVRLVYSERQPR